MNISKRNMCCVCLDAPNILYGLWEIDAGSVKWSEKLSYSVPEVEWLDHFLICISCSELVQKICDFKKLCLEADNLRKSLVNKKNKRKITAAEVSPTGIDQTETTINNVKEDEHFISLDIPKTSFENEAEPFVVVSVKKEDNTEDDTTVECVNIQTKSEEQEEKYEDPLSNFEVNDFEESKTFIEICCDQCGLNYTLKEELVEHLHTIHETYKCEFCEETLVGSDNFTSHVSDAHSKKVSTYKIFKCFTCKHRFSSATELYNHGSTHSYTCHKCVKSFRTRGALILHKKHKHSGSQKKDCVHFCKICQTHFSSYTSMKLHNKAKHTDTETWKYTCTVCNRKFPVKHSYVLHMRRHLGVKPYACQLCTKTYVSNDELGKHITAHKNGHPGKCYYCGDEYKQRREMEMHIIKEHNVTLQPARTNRVKKCLCHICNKGFYDNNQLSKHIRTHTGEKPFQCNQCEKAFSDNANLGHHLQRMHNRTAKSSVLS